MPSLFRKTKIGDAGREGREGRDWLGCVMHEIKAAAESGKLEIFQRGERFNRKPFQFCIINKFD